MKGAEILLGEVASREAAALVVDGVLDDLRIDGSGPRPGSIYRARVERQAKGQGAAFLATVDGPLFLKQSKGLNAGDMVLAQVSGFAEVGKAPPATLRLLFKSRYAIVTPDAPGMNISRSIRDHELRAEIRAAAATEAAEASAYGLILRSACQSGPLSAISEDVDMMLKLAEQVLADDGRDLEMLVEGDGPHALAWRDWPEAETRHADLSDWIDIARQELVGLGAQANMAVEATRALVAVDINTGGDTSPAAGLKANVAAMRALPRALRQRGLAGQIVIDLAPMPKKDRKSVEAALLAALKSDQVETSLVGWTPLGHIELSRKRDRPSLQEVLI